MKNSDRAMESYVHNLTMDLDASRKFMQLLFRNTNSLCSISQCSLFLDVFLAYDDKAFELQDEIRLGKTSFRNTGIAPSVVVLGRLWLALV